MTVIVVVTMIAVVFPTALLHVIATIVLVPGRRNRSGDGFRFDPIRQIALPNQLLDFGKITSVLMLVLVVVVMICV